MHIGYARVSTNEQNTEMQEMALRDAGCERIFRETASGGRWDRPQLTRLWEHLRPGDTLVVWKLDRLSRSVQDLLMILDRLRQQEVGFRSLTEDLDTTTAAGRMMVQMVGVFAEFERSLLRERTRLGLERARQQGRFGGRPSKLNSEQREEIVRMVRKHGKTSAEVARLFRVHPATVCRLLRASAEARERNTVSKEFARQTH